MPEPIVKQDGTEKNDCERNAAKRFVTKFRQDHPHLKVIVTEDSLSSNAPHIETLQSHHMRYLLGSALSTCHLMTKSLAVETCLPFSYGVRSGGFFFGPRGCF